MSGTIDVLQRKVLARYPFFGSVAAGVTYEASEKVRTSASDGRRIYYNPAWLEGLTLEAQVFALAHEMCHIAFRHARRSLGKDPILWKKATDAVVNQLLKRDGLELPPYAIDFPEAIDYDAEGYYELLMEEKLAMDLIEGNMQRPQGSGSPEQSGEEGEGEHYQSGAEENEDDHSMWEDAAMQEQQEEDEQEEKLRQELEKILEVMEDSGDAPPEGDSAEEDEDQEEQEKALVSQKVSQSGNDVNPDIRQIDDIGVAPPIFDWRLILRDTVNYNVDWSTEHAVLEDGILRPVLEERPMPETEIVLDTSWSVDDALLRNFLRECRNILQYSRLWAGCFDTVFYGFHEIRTDEDIEQMPLEGGGGTDFDTAVNAFSLRVDNRIIFTDGEADMPEKPLDAIWMVYGEETIDPAGGRVIHITPEQMEKLMPRSR